MRTATDVTTKKIKGCTLRGLLLLLLSSLILIRVHHHAAAHVGKWILLLLLLLLRELILHLTLHLVHHHLLHHELLLLLRHTLVHAWEGVGVKVATSLHHSSKVHWIRLRLLRCHETGKIWHETFWLTLVTWFVW